MLVEPERTRVKPKQTVSVGKAKVTNRTATSIEVEVGPDGAVVVTDCCLEEQGIKVE
jgi:hypothetical protein